MFLTDEQCLLLYSILTSIMSSLMILCNFLLYWIVHLNLYWSFIIFLRFACNVSFFYLWNTLCDLCKFSNVYLSWLRISNLFESLKYQHYIYPYIIIFFCSTCFLYIVQWLKVINICSSLHRSVCISDGNVPANT